MKFSFPILPFQCVHVLALAVARAAPHSVHRFLRFQSLEICDKFFGGLLHLQYVAKSFIISRATLQICFARINHCALMPLYNVHCVTARAHPHSINSIAIVVVVVVLVPAAVMWSSL